MCVRAGLRVSIVLLSLCLFIEVPVFQCLLVFRFLVFVILFAFVSFFFVCLFVSVCVLCVCVCVSVAFSALVRAINHACVRVITVLLRLCFSPCSK